MKKTKKVFGPVDKMPEADVVKMPMSKIKTKAPKPKVKKPSKKMVKMG